MEAIQSQVARMEALLSSLKTDEKVSTSILGECYFNNVYLGLDELKNFIIFYHTLKFTPQESL